MGVPMRNISEMTQEYEFLNKEIRRLQRENQLMQEKVARLAAKQAAARSPGQVSTGVVLIPMLIMQGHGTLMQARHIAML